MLNKAVTRILGLNVCTNYVDEWENDKAKHNARLKCVLERLRERGLNLHREKCQIAQTVQIFGWNINQTRTTSQPRIS